MLYKMHAPLGLVVLIGLFASNVYGGVTSGITSDCTGQIITTPSFPKGDIS